MGGDKNPFQMLYQLTEMAHDLGVDDQWPFTPLFQDRLDRRDRVNELVRDPSILRRHGQEVRP